MKGAICNICVSFQRIFMSVHTEISVTVTQTNRNQISHLLRVYVELVSLRYLVS